MLILLGIFFVSLAGATIPGDCDPSNKMIAYWQFEDDVLDSYNANRAEGNWNTTSRYNPFVVNDGADFDGEQEIMIVDNIGDLDFDRAFTIEMWIKDTYDLPYSAVLFEKGDYKISFSGRSVVASVKDVSVSSGDIEADEDYHIAVVWNSTGEALKLYVDGGERNPAG